MTVEQIHNQCLTPPSAMKNIVSLIILMVSCLPLAAAPRKSASPAPAAPDFAFPQTVAADARRSMDKAMANV